MVKSKILPYIACLCLISMALLSDPAPAAGTNDFADSLRATSPSSTIKSVLNEQPQPALHNNLNPMTIEILQGRVNQIKTPDAQVQETLSMVMQITLQSEIVLDEEMSIYLADLTGISRSLIKKTYQELIQRADLSSAAG